MISMLSADRDVFGYARMMDEPLSDDDDDSDNDSKSSSIGRQRSLGSGVVVDPDGYPATAPPWGTLNALDLSTGKYLWKIPLGEYPELAAKGMKNTGSENYGGPVVTAAGLVFIAGTVYDRNVRAFDSKTGHLLWKANLQYAWQCSSYNLHDRWKAICSDCYQWSA